jgi:hypothetical protein
MLLQLRQRLVRIVAANDNPLRRRVDRIQSAVVAGLVVAFVVAAPLLSIVAVQVTGAAAVREQRAEANWLSRTAVLQESAAAGLVADDGAFDSWVTVSWKMPGGAKRSGRVAVDLNARKGQRMTVWVTPAGQLTRPKLTRAEVLEWETTAAIVTPTGLALLLMVAGGVVRVAANRRRMAGWTRAWAAAAGPGWSSLR